MSGCSTVPGLIELLAERALECATGHADQSANETACGTPDAAEPVGIRATLILGSQNEVSPALVYQLLRPLGRVDARNERAFGQLEPVVLSDGRRVLAGTYPSPLDADGAASLPVAFWVGFDRNWITRGLALAAPLLARLGEPWLRRIARIAPFVAGPVRAVGTPRGALLVEAVSAGGDVLASVEVTAAANGLDVPALPAVWAAAALLRPSNINTRCRGPLRLCELINADAAIDALRACATRQVREWPRELRATDEHGAMLGGRRAGVAVSA